MAHRQKKVRRNSEAPSTAASVVDDTDRSVRVESAAALPVGDGPEQDLVSEDVDMRTSIE